jgi:hypothetical protein
MSFIVFKDHIGFSVTFDWGKSKRKTDIVRRQMCQFKLKNWHILNGDSSSKMEDNVRSHGTLISGL